MPLFDCREICNLVCKCHWLVCVCMYMIFLFCCFFAVLCSFFAKVEAIKTETSSILKERDRIESIQRYERVQICYEITASQN